MPIDSQPPASIAAPAPERRDPSGFVISISLTLFGLTLLSVLAMHFATRYGW